MAALSPGQLDRINYANIALMGLAAVCAYLAPYHCFLVSFAVLGPLHYLTQISWLHERRYFSHGRWDFLCLVALALLDTYAKTLGIAQWTIAQNTIRIAFLGAGAMAFLSNPRLRWAAIGAAVLSAFIPLPFSQRLFFSVFLTTLVHVYLFTWMFILHGALKSKSATGYLSLAVHTLLGIGTLSAAPPWLFELSAYLQDSLKATGNLNLHLGRALGLDLEGPQATMAMQFVAFTYTYHYLNWFSKTQLIAWHKVSRARLAAIGALWIGFVGLYAYDFRTGLACLLALSMAHALLEFPLNYKTAVGIVQEVRARFRHPPKKKKHQRYRRAA